MILDSRSSRILAFSAAFFFAGAMLIISIGLAGYGHGGWGWGLMPSILGLVGVPLAFSSWMSPQQTGRRRASNSLAIAVVADIFVAPGFLLAFDAFSVAGIGGFLWFMFFLAWHIVASVRLLKREE